MWRLVWNLSQLFDHIINVVRFNVCDWIEILVHEIWEQDQVINTANRWCYHPRWFHAPRFANGLTNPLPCSLLIFVPGQKSWNMRLNWCLTCHPPISLLKWRNEIDAEEIIVSEHEPQVQKMWAHQFFQTSNSIAFRILLLGSNNITQCLRLVNLFNRKQQFTKKIAGCLNG